MGDLQILYEFLVSLLPGALLAKALALVPIVVALVGLLRRIPAFDTHKRLWAPLAALVLGLVFGFAATGFDLSQPLLGVGAGLVIFLASVGGHSTVKNALQAVASPTTRIQSVAAALQEPTEEKRYKDSQLVYAAHSRCPCGAGLAYAVGTRSGGAWDCSAILTGRAVPSGQPGAVTHTDKLPFAFWEILSERQPSANGATTRPPKK